MGKSKKGIVEGKPEKVKPERKYTRAQAEKALSAGADPEQFTKHANYHVRAKAWVKMGRPLPEGKEEDQEKFLRSIHQWKAPPEAVSDPIG